VYALKILRKTKGKITECFPDRELNANHAAVIKLEQVDHVRHERQILAEVQGHPFITDFVASFSDHDFLYILLDYVPGGELFTYLRKSREFDQDVARLYAAEIVLVLEHLHEHQGGIAYRDMKPENLLLDAEGHIKFVDLGFAKRLGNDESGQPNKTYTLCGTPEYIAPEVILGEGYTTAVDWWALGILIYEFLTGYPPFWHEDVYVIYERFVSPLHFLV
jgi:protein kinase A